MADGEKVSKSDEDDAFDLETMMEFHRMDSSEVIYQGNKKAKYVTKYMLGDILGEGSYSKVKEALDMETLERRAVKIMKRQRLKKIPNGEINVKREISLLKTLNHENIVSLIGTHQDNIKEKFYVFMEYCVIVLQELLDYAPAKKLPIWQAHGYFIQLLNGLEYLHNLRVIHKDIKPGNLLLTTGGILKITDFGVSEQLDIFVTDDYCEHSQGSPAFQPPEIAMGLDRFHGFKVDVWASGITLYNMTTGLYPYEGENIYMLFENIATKELTVPLELDDLLTEYLNGLLNKNADERFSVKQCQEHNWIRKSHPRLIPKVGMPKRLDNSLRRITVLPVLADVHYDQDRPPDRVLNRNFEKLRERFDLFWRNSQALAGVISRNQLPSV